MMAFFEHHGAWGLFCLAFAESSFFPVAPDFLLIPLGLQAPEQAWRLALVTTCGSALGGLFGYWIGWSGGRKLLLHVASPERVAQVEALFDRWGVWAVAVAGFTPIPYKVFTICAGLCRLRLAPFVIASVLSRGLRFFLIVALLRRYGEAAQSLLDRYGWWTIVVLAVLLLLWLVTQRVRRHRPATTAAEEVAA